MASVAAPVAPTNGRDELDRIIDYEDTVQDFMKDLPLPENPNVGANGGPQRETRDEDQEIQIKRKRNAIPKLDEDRLVVSSSSRGRGSYVGEAS
jgi:replication fork protection complex subunit Csm3/Swi3